MVSTIAFTGLGLVVTAGHAAKDGFNALSARGERALAEDTMAGAVHRAVTRELPAAVGQALGTALERSVHAVEVTRQTAARVPAALERAVEVVCAHAGLPTQQQIAELRARVDTLAQVLDRLAAHQPPAPPWEEQDNGSGA